jgi:hypothetical protein
MLEIAESFSMGPALDKAVVQQLASKELTETDQRKIGDGSNEMQDIKRAHDIIAYHAPRNLETTNAEAHETERVVQAVISLTGIERKGGKLNATFLKANIIQFSCFKEKRKKKKVEQMKKVWGTGTFRRMPAQGV